MAGHAPQAAPSDGIRVERHEGVATVVFDRPERMNALTAACFAALPGCVGELAEDPDVCCVVLTGSGERAFSAAPIIRSFEFCHSRQQILDRLDRVSAGLGLDRERCRGWTIAQTVAWSFDSDYAKQHLETMQWLLEMA